ncbi:MAG: OmpA family protein [Cytophagales bacterium]|nr:OmpA family protein [Cytophagales bacterium]
MNNLTIKGTWTEAKGKLKQKYAQLTDDDLILVEGKTDELYGRLQQRLGKSLEEIKEVLKEYLVVPIEKERTMKKPVVFNKAMTLIAIFTLVIVSQGIIGCGASKSVKGGVIGAGAGGAIGGVIGHKAGNTVVGAIIGAAVGGTAGALIGQKMDRQAAELQNDLKGATVQRVGEGILITFNSGLQFDTNSSLLQPNTKTNLNSLSSTLKKYDDTLIRIEGHTDNVGESLYNERLSEKRAFSVEDYLSLQGVRKDRMTTRGYGEEQPLNNNLTEDERRSNRRVEVAIFANKAMKKLAKQGKI